MINVVPYLKNHSRSNLASFRACSKLLASLSEYQNTRKAQWFKINNPVRKFRYYFFNNKFCKCLFHVVRDKISGCYFGMILQYFGIIFFSTGTLGCQINKYTEVHFSSFFFSGFITAIALCSRKPLFFPVPVLTNFWPPRIFSWKRNGSGINPAISLIFYYIIK